jgi:hypothetical protein
MSVKAIPQSVPDSILPYPEGSWNRVKYVFWKAVYPIHNDLRNFLLITRILKHEGRQDYAFGVIAPGRNMQDFLKHLEKHQFGNHFIAWDDDDQVMSLRRLDGFERQYHVRIFSDGEVRGHYEFTPECYPILHYKAHGQEERREEFSGFFGDWVVEKND